MSYDYAAGLAKCRECGRTFDLDNEDDADEVHYGHDCEEPPPLDTLGAEYSALYTRYVETNDESDFDRMTELWDTMTNVYGKRETAGAFLRHYRPKGGDTE